MEHQFRRGIYRPNAQRLSLSLAPLVAQRSLLFRIKADLATKTNYGQLTPTTDESESESPGLFALTASAQILSAALSVMSAMSSASVYSQDSWKGNSPCVHVVQVDTRRHAIAFSPSVQWSDLSEEDDLEEPVVEEPLHSAHTSEGPTISIKQDSSLSSATPLVEDSVQRHDTVNSGADTQESEKNATKLKKKSTENASKRISKHSKAFGKVMSRISLQPSKKELAEKRRTAITIIHPSSQYKLPEFQVSDPIRMSFIAKSVSDMPALPTIIPVASAIASIAEEPNQEKETQALQRVRVMRATMPATPSWRQRSLTPPPSAALVPPTPAPCRRRRDTNGTRALPL
ncbi:hypothetical protein BDZ97DRAFT_1927632 [Flammula alnicola]|nr:hypothetical protein BDZ97DRAFT_1927632 [Flammula alnicola]